MEDIEESLKTLNTEINQLIEKRNKLGQEHRRKQEEKKKLLNQLSTSCNIPLYVCYSVDLDSDCLKKSEIKILGVYTTKEQAISVCDGYFHEGYSSDERCYYTDYIEMPLNEYVYYEEN